MHAFGKGQKQTNKQKNNNQKKQKTTTTKKQVQQPPSLHGRPDTPNAWKEKKK